MIVLANSFSPYRLSHNIERFFGESDCKILLEKVTNWGPLTHTGLNKVKGFTQECEIKFSYISKSANI